MAISEFQLALVGAGAAGVAGVWAYNAWQEYRQRRAAEKIFRGSQQDVLIGAQPASEDDDSPAFERTAAGEPPRERVEPVISVPQSDAIGNDAEAMAQEADDAATPAVAAADAPGEECIDPMIELGMAFPPDLSFADIQPAWRDANVEFRKRIRWIGRDVGSGEWIEIDNPSSANAGHVHVAIQLADRQGAIDRNELSAFCSTAEAIAVAHGGARGIPSLDEILAHANALDDLCAAVDVQIAIHIVGRGGQDFAGTRLRGMLEAAGLQLATDGLFYLIDAEGRRLLSVGNAGAAPFDPEQMRSGAIADATFWLDVPGVANGGVAFDTMLAIARQLAQALDGVLVDDQRNPLADNVLAGIRAKVVELQTQMTSHGIPAGGRRALRLFA